MVSNVYEDQEAASDDICDSLEDAVKAVPGYTIAPPTKPCLQMLDIKKNSQRQKNLKCVSISAFSFLDIFPLCLRLFDNV